MNIQEIFSQFNTGSHAVSITPFGSGNIHQTFLAKSSDGKESFILQKINSFVFKDILALTENFHRISTHLSKKVVEENINWEILRLFPTNNGTYYFTNDDGSYWRLINYIDHSEYKETDNNIYIEAGSAYGTFIRLLSDLEKPPLKETIPSFHNLELRMDNFFRAEATASHERKSNASQEIKYIKEQADSMLYIPTLLKEGKLNIRTTHNDTKLDNILFTKGRAKAVIDFDTVMPGLVHYDFGDSIRSFANSCKEDDKNYSRVEFRLDIYESFTSAFLNSLKEILSVEEVKSLAYSPQMFAYMQGVRFLTDYLNNDIYYRIDYPEHNMVRTRNQFALLECMKKNFNQMEKIIHQSFN
jgi:hypothetical protein